MPGTSDRAHDFPTGGTDRITIGVSVRDPLLSAQRDCFDTFDVAADDVLLAYVVGEAVVVAITLVEADVRLLRRGCVGHDAEPTTMRADGIRPNIESMSDSTTINVKIGVTFAPREIEIEIEDVEAFVSDFDAAMSSDSRVWWITDSSGRRRGLVADKVSYVDIEPPLDRTVGFG